MIFNLLNVLFWIAFVYSFIHVSKIKEDYYNIDGKLRIKNITLPHSFSGKIIKEGKKATLNATSAINRLDFNIGKSSDPKAEWVSNNINLNIKIECLFSK